MEPFVSFVVVIQATINQFATPIRNLPINRADRSDLRSASSQSNDQTANSHSFVSMEACQVRQARDVGSDSGNDGFSEPEQLTQRKSKRLTEGFVCNPLLFAG